MLGMKQETLAYELGDEWTQKKISQLESKETVEGDILEQVAKILKVNPEAIKTLSDESVVNIFSGTFQDNASASGVSYNYPTFNPIDKLIESYEESKRLYERLIQAEKDKVAYLEGKDKNG